VRVPVETSTGTLLVRTSNEGLPDKFVKVVESDVPAAVTPVMITTAMRPEFHFPALA